jgi:hypothetical protein
MERVRGQLTAGGAWSSSWVLYGGLAAWVFAGFGVAVAAIRGRPKRLMGDVLALGLAAGAIIVWYAVLSGHAYQHRLFMIRPIALACGCGIAAALLAAVALVKDRLGRLMMGIGGVGSLIAAGVIIGPYWGEGLGADVSLARFVDVPSDLVGCHPLGLQPDGKRDGLIEFTYRRFRSPFAMVGLAATIPIYIRLERASPPGVYDTADKYYVLGISDTPTGPLLNQPDGSMPVEDEGEHHHYAHFCRDGHDPPNAYYRIVVDGSAKPVQ